MNKKHTVMAGAVLSIAIFGGEAHAHESVSFELCAKYAAIDQRLEDAVSLAEVTEESAKRRAKKRYDARMFQAGEERKKSADAGVPYRDRLKMILPAQKEARKEEERAMQEAALAKREAVETAQQDWVKAQYDLYTEVGGPMYDNDNLMGTLLAAFRHPCKVAYGI